mmetsp:Transcript_596/g.1111  ORF Transcript_596/g.1111 Transcript_596/m.1111 type:complete len:933 (+) Transcript_596:101-2899(+)
MSSQENAFAAGTHSSLQLPPTSLQMLDQFNRRLDDISSTQYELSRCLFSKLEPAVQTQCQDEACCLCLEKFPASLDGCQEDTLLLTCKKLGWHHAIHLSCIRNVNSEMLSEILNCPHITNFFCILPGQDPQDEPKRSVNPDWSLRCQVQHLLSDLVLTSTSELPVFSAGDSAQTRLVATSKTKTQFFVDRARLNVTCYHNASQHKFTRVQGCVDLSGVDPKISGVNLLLVDSDVRLSVRLFRVPAFGTLTSGWEIHQVVLEFADQLAVTRPAAEPAAEPRGSSLLSSISGEFSKLLLNPDEDSSGTVNNRFSILLSSPSQESLQRSVGSRELSGFSLTPSSSLFPSACTTQPSSSSTSPLPSRPESPSQLSPTSSVVNIQQPLSQQLQLPPQQLQHHNYQKQQLDAKNAGTNLWSTGGMNVGSMAKNQSGSRFLQQQIEQGGSNFIATILPELLNYNLLAGIMTDLFGNYLCQKLIAHASPAQRLTIIKACSDFMIKVACDRQGTRVIQALVNIASSNNERVAIVNALAVPTQSQPEPKQLLQLIQNPYSTHVIHAILGVFPFELYWPICRVALANVATLGLDRHGLCVIKKSVTLAPTDVLVKFIPTVMGMALKYVNDQYGNYLLQHVLEHSKTVTTDPSFFDISGSFDTLCYDQLHQGLKGHYSWLSRQKFASNVIEMIVRSAKESVRTEVIEELTAEKVISRLLLCSYGNYVMQNVIEVCTPEQVALIFRKIQPDLPFLRKNVRKKWERLLLAYQANSETFPAHLIRSNPPPRGDRQNPTSNPKEMSVHPQRQHHFANELWEKKLDGGNRQRDSNKLNSNSWLQPPQPQNQQQHTFGNRNSNIFHSSNSVGSAAVNDNHTFDQSSLFAQIQQQDLQQLQHLQQLQQQVLELGRSLPFSQQSLLFQQQLQQQQLQQQLQQQPQQQQQQQQ